MDRLKALQEKMQAGLAAAGLSENVEFQIDQRGLTVKLVGSQAFFEPDRPELTGPGDPGAADHLAGPEAGPAWKSWSRATPRTASRRTPPRGSCPRRAPSTSCGTWWTTAASPRAPSAPSRSDRPGQVNDDSTPALMERNRRVDIVVLSDKPDVVRALIPEALKLSQK